MWSDILATHPGTLTHSNTEMTGDLGGEQKVCTHITSCDPLKKAVNEMYIFRADGEWNWPITHVICCLEFSCVT